MKKQKTIKAWAVVWSNTIGEVEHGKGNVVSLTISPTKKEASRCQKHSEGGKVVPIEITLKPQKK